VAALEEVQGRENSENDNLKACYDDLQRGTVAMEEHFVFVVLCDVLFLLCN
jgi:hypothetical protein